MANVGERLKVLYGDAAKMIIQAPRGRRDADPAAAAYLSES